MGDGYKGQGHTDSRPISTSRFPSNWELSTSRATAVLRFLAGTGIDPGRLSAMGYGDTHPVGDNATAEGQARNRRVEIIVLTDVTLEPILADAAGDNPATTDGGGTGGETADGARANGAPAPAGEPRAGPPRLRPPRASPGTCTVKPYQPDHHMREERVRGCGL